MCQADMDNNKDYYDRGENWEANYVDSDSDLEYASVSIGLNKTGEPGSGYRTRNDPSAPFQRPTVAERRGIIEVRCNAREVIHGAWSADAEDNATLLVYDFHLGTTRRSRRIISAMLDFEFGSIVPGTPAPQVHAIAPEVPVTLNPSTQDKSITRLTTVNASTGIPGVNVGGTVKWVTTVDRTTDDYARVTGHIFSDDYGKGVGVRWVATENRSLESGVPSFLRCAILLNRGGDNSNFQCKVRIKGEADWKSEICGLFGTTPPDDPILFDPSLPPTNKLLKSGYDTENLGSIKLDDIVEILFHKALENGKVPACRGPPRQC